MYSDSIVIIPTYNEKENIENIIRAVLGLSQPFNILIIDDGSPDGTADIVKRLMSDEFKDRLFLIQRKGKLHISPVSNGPSNRNMIISLRWMPISAITPMICPDCIKPVQKKVMM